MSNITRIKSLSVYMLIIIFAWSSWIDINGLMVQLPLFVQKLPEGWNLPSYMIILIQIANVGPLIYTVMMKKWPNKVNELLAVYVIIGIGLISCCLLIFLWDKTATVYGKERSIGFLSLTTLLAVVDTSSSVVYLPYMNRFKPQYMTAFYIGEGFSGLVPGLVGLFQGVGKEHRCVNSSLLLDLKTLSNDTNPSSWKMVPVESTPTFTVEIFIAFLCAMLLVSAIAFSCINYVPFAKRQLDSNQKDVNSPCTDIREIKYTELSKGKLSKIQVLYLLILTCWINAMTNGILPSIQSFACVPYSKRAYKLTVQLSQVANPIACFICLFSPLPTIKTLTTLSTFGAILSIYQIVLAVRSPNQPFRGIIYGEILAVATAVLIILSLVYTKVTTASLLRRHGGKISLLWCGAVSQLGSFIGALVSFLVINVFNLLQSLPDKGPSELC